MKNELITLPGVPLTFTNAEYAPAAFVAGHKLPDAVSISPSYESVKSLVSGKPIARAGSRLGKYIALSKGEIQNAREAIESGRTEFVPQDVE